MRVRSRPGERRWRSAGIAQAARLPSLYGTAARAAYAGAMNSVQKEGAVALFAMTLGRGNNDTRYRLPTRQMGWPTLGCNQQDPRNASERLGNGKPTRMVPMVAGGRAANTAHHLHLKCR